MRPGSKSPKSHVVIATRGSRLALWQADYVAGLLRERGVSSEKLVLKTTADRIQDRFLHEIGGKGLFIRELEEALLQGQADLAVHSLKDMPARLPETFDLPAILKRHAPGDVLIFRDDVVQKLQPPDLIRAEDLQSFPALKIGTGSLRRQSLLRRHAPVHTSVGLRGNVDTRIAKLREGQFDAIILAEASLERLEIRDVAARRICPVWFIPSPSQGALALETLKTSPLRPWLAEFACPATTRAVAAERETLALLGGDCTMPFGCHVTSGSHGRLHVSATVLAPDGDHATITLDSDSSIQPHDLAQKIAGQLRQAGGGRILGKLGIALPGGWASC